MATIVSLQENKIERIDKDTEEAETNIGKGKKDVQSIYDRVSSNRALILKVFAILITFSVIYILFLL